MSSVSRVTRSKQEARKNYDRLSVWYDLFAKSEQKFTALGLDAFSAQTGERLLEIGHGTGWALCTLARAAYPATTHGIDLSGKMSRAARERLGQTACEPNQVFLCNADGAALPYQDSFFDGVFISFTLELFDTPEIPHVLGEIARVLKKEGRLGVVSLAKTECTAVRVYEWFHERMPVLVDCRPISVAQNLQEAGFQIRKERDAQMWGLPVSAIVASPPGGKIAPCD